MIVTVSTALAKLGIASFVLKGEPKNETEFNEMFRITTGVDDNGAPIENADQSAWGVTWSEVSTKLTELHNAAPMQELREERNRRLAQTDWWAGSDLTMTQAQTDYRQALRDITDNATSLDDVTWPTKP